MTLVAKLRYSVTGKMLARAVDGQSERNGWFWTVTNRVMNTADARRSVRVWARVLRDGLYVHFGKSNGSLCGGLAYPARAKKCSQGRANQQTTLTRGT